MDGTDEDDDELDDELDDDVELGGRVNLEEMGEMVGSDRDDDIGGGREGDDD